MGEKRTGDTLFSVGQKAFIRRGEEMLVIFDPVPGLDFPGGRITTGEIEIWGFDCTCE